LNSCKAMVSGYFSGCSCFQCSAAVAAVWVAIESIKKRIERQKQISKTMVIAILQPDVIDLRLEVGAQAFDMRLKSHTHYL